MFKVDKELEQQILKIYNNSNGSWKTKNIKKNPVFVEYINAKYNNTKMDLSHKLRLLNNNIHNIPLCFICSSPVNFVNKKTCSIKCRNQLLKQNSHTKTEKFKQTMMKRYGVTNPAHNKQTQDKRIQTMLTKYGAKVSPKTRDLAISRVSNLNKKGRKTLKEKYGVSNAGQLPNHREKCKDTLLKNYGVDNYFESDDFKLISNENRLKNLIELVPTDISICSIDNPVTELTNSYANPNKRITFLCKQCQKTETIPTETLKFRLRMFQTPCGTCSNVKGSHSRKEKDIVNYIKSLYTGEIIENTKTIIAPYELDIFLPNKNIAVEFCGLFWHNDNRLKKEYHENKLKMCNERNIRLITIFEDEWDHKKSIVQNRLRHILNFSQTVCYARQCTIKEIDASVAKEFCNENHIQGYTPSCIKLGAYYKNQLVGVMTFAKPNISKGAKHKKDNHWELSRFCTKENVPGLANKLFKHFCKSYSPEVVISYADLRWNTGVVYEILGFTFDYDTPINYWYINGSKRKHRFALRKTKDDNQLLTEWENRKQQGWNRIWDCGHAKYIWKANKNGA